MEEKGKIKVLMIGPDRSVHGGISGVVNNYYEAGLSGKIDLYYIGTMAEGGRVYKFFWAAKAFLLFCLKVPGYQIVHINVASDSSYYRKSIFIRTAKAFNKKIVIHQHGGNFGDFYANQLNRHGRKSVRKVFSMGDVFLALSPEWKRFFSDIIEEDKIVVLPNAIKVPAMEKKQYGRHKLLFLGRICRTKGIGELLEAIPELKKEYPDMEVYLGGIWDDKELEGKAGTHPKGVTYLGWVSGEEKKKYLRLCDIFVLPTYFEGQPVSVLEAMAFSCAVVAAGVGGIPQMIEDGRTGILIEPQDVESLKGGLEKVLGDEKLCRRLGENARERVKEEFSIDKNIEQLLQVYRKVLGLP